MTQESYIGAGFNNPHIKEMDREKAEEVLK